MSHPNTIQAEQICQQLPAMFQQAMAEEDRSGPLTAIVSQMADYLQEIERSLDRRLSVIDPQTARYHQEPAQNELHWLASWLDIPTDEAMVEGTDLCGREHLGEDCQKLRSLIPKIKKLYDRRGTPRGLKDLIEQSLHDVEIEVREWAWPTGMVIGHESTIGIDTLLTDVSNLARSFMVLWHISEDFASRYSHWIQWQDVFVETEDCVQRITVGRIITEAFTGHILPHVAKTFIRITEWVNLEKPAHMRCYIALTKRSERRQVPVSFPPMVIGLHSDVGLCFLS